MFVVSTGEVPAVLVEKKYTSAVIECAGFLLQRCFE